MCVAGNFYEQGWKLLTTIRDIRLPQAEIDINEQKCLLRIPQVPEQMRFSAMDRFVTPSHIQRMTPKHRIGGWVDK